jgi:hypothetical protein
MHLLELVFERLGRSADGITGTAGVGMVGILTAAAVLVGVGSPGLRPELSNVGAWLGSESVGMVVHVNGLSGRPDGRVMLRGANGHPLRVVQRGTAAYVIDDATGQVSRVDPSQLDVAQTRGYGAAGLQVVVGAGAAYVIDPARGLVQRIDPESLAVIGQPILMAAPLGQAALDGQGTLWVPEPAAGRVVPVRGGHEATPVGVGHPGDRLALTMAGGTPVVTDATTATSTVVGSTGGSLTVNLPTALATSSPTGLLAPAATAGPVVPVLAPSNGALALVDTSRGSLATVALDVQGDQFGAPQALGRRVYVPDLTRGSLIVYDAAAGQFDSQITVTGHAGPLEVFTQDGQLWVNDESGAAALVVQADGSAHLVGKYDQRVPGGRAPGQPPAAPPARRAPVAVPNRPTPTPTPTPLPRATPTPPPPTAPPPPLAPATVTASSGPGYITVTFKPSSSGTPTGYALLGAAAGVTVQPAQVPVAGPYTFQVRGGACATQYSYQVAALYQGGQVASQPTVAVRPCVAPAAPQITQVATDSHQVALHWSAPANAAGSQVTYAVTWRGTTSGSPPTTTSLNQTVTGLTNGGTYTFVVTAANDAGSGRASMPKNVVLTGPTPTLGVHNLQGGAQLIVYIRDVPTTQGGRDVGSVRQGGTVTVQCQDLQGGFVKDPHIPNLQGSVWDRVSGGWMSDLYVLTNGSNAGQSSYPQVWPCT